MRKPKELHELEFDELVNLAAERALDNFIRGTEFRKVIWSAVELGVRWNSARDVQSMKPKRKR